MNGESRERRRRPPRRCFREIATVAWSVRRAHSCAAALVGWSMLFAACWMLAVTGAPPFSTPHRRPLNASWLDYAEQLYDGKLHDCREGPLNKSATWCHWVRGIAANGRPAWQWRPCSPLPRLPCTRELARNGPYLAVMLRGGETPAPAPAPDGALGPCPCCCRRCSRRAWFGLGLGLTLTLTSPIVP